MAIDIVYIVYVQSENGGETCRFFHINQLGAITPRRFAAANPLFLVHPHIHHENR